MPRRRFVSWLAGVAFVPFLAVVIAVAGSGTPTAQLLAALSIGVMIAHAFLGLGAVDTAIFVATTLLISFAVENLGVATGVPFGHYVFTVGATFPHVGRIPIIVGGLYVGMGYAAWVIASLIVAGHVGRPRDRLECFAIPAAAAFVMVQWDTVLDPVESTLARNWVWFGRGGYFGVPLTNFLGWYLTTWLIFQTVAGLLFYRRDRSPYRARSSVFWSMPVLFYLAAGLCHVPRLRDADALLRDGAGRPWSAADLRQTAVVVLLVTMVPSALLALLALIRRPRLPDAV